MGNVHSMGRRAKVHRTDSRGEPASSLRDYVKWVIPAADPARAAHPLSMGRAVTVVMSAWMRRTSPKPYDFGLYIA